MAGTATATANKPVWVDLGAKDPAAARDFHSKLFGWPRCPGRRGPSVRIQLGGREIVRPFDFPGGRMSIVTDPEGAAFGLMTLSEG